MQGGSGLSSSTVSLGRQSGRELTGPGRKAWITPPGGSALRAELHCNGALNWGDLHIPLGRPTVEGGEDGGGTRPVSGRKRCLPRPSHLLMHFREEWNRRRLPAIGLRPQEPVVQPRAFGRRRRPPVQPDALSGPGKHSSQFWI